MSRVYIYIINRQQWLIFVYRWFILSVNNKILQKASMLDNNRTCVPQNLSRKETAPDRWNFVEEWADIYTCKHTFIHTFIQKPSAQDRDVLKMGLSSLYRHRFTSAYQDGEHRSRVSFAFTIPSIIILPPHKTFAEIRFCWTLLPLT
jgi:hypothetical protein